MTCYEWVIEPLDEYGDIIEVWQRDTFAEAVRDAKQYTHADVKRVAIALTRCWSRDWDMHGLENRQYAYLEDGKLPEHFEAEGGGKGAKVPEKFRREVANA